MRRMRCWAWTVAMLLFAIQFALMALIVRGESLTFDEGDHIYAGYMMWHAHDYGLNPEHPPLVKLVATLPFLGKPLWVPPNQDRFFKIEAYMNGRDFLVRNDGPGQHLVFRARMAAGIFAIGLSVAVFLVGLEWFGDVPALLALALVVFEPNVLANSALVTTDIAVTCFLLLSVFCFYRYARNPSLASLLLAGLAAGCTFGAKHSGILLAPPLLVLVLVEVLLAERGTRARRLKTMTLGVVGIALVAVFVLWSFYGFRFAARPAGLTLNPSFADYSSGLHAFDHWVVTHLYTWHLLPESYLVGLADVRLTADGVAAFILGKNLAHGVWWYFPVALSIKTTLGLMGLVLVAAFAVVARRLRKLRELMYVILPGAFYLGVAMSSHISIGVWHVLLLYPLGSLLAGAGAWALIQTNRHWAWVVGVLVLFHIYAAMAVFPVEIAYANEAWGGPRNVHKYLNDANVEWGQQLLDVKRWVDAHPGEPCWFAYVARPLLSPEEYGIHCVALPTVDTQFLGGAEDVTPVVKGNVLLSGDDLAGCEWPSAQLNPYRTFQSVPITEQIDYGVFVFRGVFRVPEIAAFSAVQKAQFLLIDGKNEQALAAAQLAVSLNHGDVRTQSVLGDAAVSLGHKKAAQTAYRAALMAAHALEPGVQPQFVPEIEGKLAKLEGH